MSRNITRDLAAIFLGVVLVAGVAGPSLASAALPSPLTVVAQHDGCYANGSARATLTFHNPSGFAFVWEYRVDDQPADGNGFWPGVYTGFLNGVDYGSQRSVTAIFAVTLEQRLQYGAESDWFYNWQTITNPCVPLTSKDQCKGRGWANYLDVTSQAACTKRFKA